MQSKLINKTNMAKTLSIVEYIHELREAGFSDRQAEVQASKLEQLIKDIKSEIKEDIKTQDLATKKDIIEAELRLLRWIIWTGVGVVVALGGTLGGMLGRGFHWF